MHFLYLGLQDDRFTARQKSTRSHLLHDELGAVAAVTDPWSALGYCLADETCIANIDVARLPLTCGGTTRFILAIRNVVVARRWRGMGLFQNLMREALHLADRTTDGLALLYTEEPSLYGRFGFKPICQHSFIGPWPDLTIPALAATSCDLDNADEFGRFTTCLARRTPLSNLCALALDADQIRRNLQQDDSLCLLYLATPETFVVSTHAPGVAVIADIVTEHMPPLSVILGMIDQKDCLQTLFSPDRLAWRGTPTIEDTGLMMRNPPMELATTPFMLPPTMEF